MWQPFLIFFPIHIWKDQTVKFLNFPLCDHTHRGKFANLIVQPFRICAFHLIWYPGHIHIFPFVPQMSFIFADSKMKFTVGPHIVSGGCVLWTSFNLAESLPLYFPDDTILVEKLDQLCYKISYLLNLSACFLKVPCSLFIHPLCFLRTRS